MTASGAERAGTSGAAWLALAMGLCAGCSDASPPATMASCDEAGIICPLAGIGVAAFNGDGLPAEETAMYLPSAVHVGPADGLIYIMDFNNMRLRRIEADGTMETVAGSGTHALASPGPALASPLENPVDFDFLPDGSIAFVSAHDPRILRLVDGELSVIAGTGTEGNDGDDGDALEATFIELWGIAAAPDGTLYVSDRENHRVRVISPDGLVRAFAGTGEEGFAGDGDEATSALLKNPEGLHVAPDGSVYVADTGNHAIRRVTPSGVIETIAGTGSPGYDGDDGPATAAMLNGADGVFVEGETIYVADTENHAVRIIDGDGVIRTLAGDGEEGDAGDRGPASQARLFGPTRVFATSDRVFIADQRNCTIRTIQR